MPIYHCPRYFHVYVKKNQINKSDNRGTITIARCGLASGADGPCFYLVKAEKIDVQTFKGNFSIKHGAPPGSKVIPTPNSSMTDKVWNEMAPSFEKGLQDIHVVKNHPYLWMIQVEFFTTKTLMVLQNIAAYKLKLPLTQ